MGVLRSSLVVPPVPETVTSKLAGVATRAQVDVARVALQVVNAVGDDDTFGKAVEIVVIGLYLVLCVQVSIPIEVAQVLSLLGVYTDHWIACDSVGYLQGCDVLKLLVPVRNGFHGAFFWALRRR